MYIPVLITVIVQLCTLICAESGNNAAQTEINIDQSTQKEINVTGNVNSTLLIKVTNSTLNITTDLVCDGYCHINKKVRKNISRDDCNILKENEPTSFNVKIKYALAQNDSGKWVCEINLQEKEHQFSFNLTVESLEQFWKNYGNCIVAGIISLLVILIIVGQTICIIHFRRKAKAVRMHASLSKRPNQSGGDTARYSSMPGTKIKIEPCIEARESGIYEVLENVRAPVPEPPPLTTLPRKGANHRATSPSAEAPTAANTSARTFTNGILLPLTLRKKQQKDSDSDSKRSTLERIKVRPPMELPTEDIYEVMERSPTPPRKEYPKREAFLKKDLPKKDTFPKRVVPKKEEFRGFSTQPRLKPVPVPANVQHVASTLKPQILPSQLREALEQRNRGNTIESATKGLPYNPGLPPPLATPPRLTAPHTPRPGVSAQTGRAPPPAPSGPGGPRGLSGPGGSQGPTGPGVPQGHGGPGVSKWRPPPPAKPKQLHPLPPPPRPESIQVTTEGGGEDDSDEEWIYEPLPSISSFNIYSNT